MTRRKRYSKELKREALRRANDEGVTDTLVAEEMGFSTRQLRRWRDEAKEHGDDAFPGYGKARDKEMMLLRRKLKKTEQERDFFKGSGGVLCQGVEVRYRCIHRRRNLYPIQMMCQAMKVSTRGYYAWRTRPESRRKHHDRELMQANDCTLLSRARKD